VTVVVTPTILKSQDLNQEERLQPLQMDNRKQYRIKEMLLEWAMGLPANFWTYAWGMVTSAGSKLLDEKFYSEYLLVCKLEQKTFRRLIVHSRDNADTR
jgi:hypothetical protein